MLLALWPDAPALCPDLRQSFSCSRRFNLDNLRRIQSIAPASVESFLKKLLSNYPPQNLPWDEAKSVILPRVFASAPFFSGVERALVAYVPFVNKTDV